ncbi:MAG: O-antigen ligase family protein [Mobilitalea sp.]
MSKNSNGNKVSNKNKNNIGKAQHNNSSYNNKRHNEEVEPSYYLIPIFIVLCIIPLLVRMKLYNPNMSQFAWFANNVEVSDFFLYYKQWTFVLVIAITAVIIAYKVYSAHKVMRFTPILIPLAIYGLLALLSTIFSEYASFSLSGSFEQFESIFVLLGYCIMTYYAFLFVDSERDLKNIISFLLIIALIMSLLGILQFTGNDFLGTRSGYKLIMPLKYQSDSPLEFVFGENRVFLTLYNPNYVGVYVALVLPIIMIMLLFKRSIKNIIFSFIAIAGLVICVLGAQSLTGVMGLAAAILVILIFMWRYLIKRIYITVPAILLLVIGLIVLNNQTDQILVTKVVNTIVNSKTNFALMNMDTNDNNVSLTYNENNMYVYYAIDDAQNISLYALDEDNQLIAGTFDASTNAYTITDQRFLGIVIGIDAASTNQFYIQESGIQWKFTNRTEDGTYYYVNRMGKLDKMITAPSAVFTGYEFFASGRGYIWSRTIPILKDYIFLGSGPDTFAMAFPQQDYINFSRYGFGAAILTKPHNLYLQIATQTGILSLIAFFVFYAMYFVSSVRLYIRGRFNSYYAKVGVAIFAGTVAYMVTGLTNDSSTTVAPIFWTLMGVGLATNYKVKPLIQKEIADNKFKKTAIKEARNK